MDSSPSAAILSVRGLTKSFGALSALSGLSFDVQRGEIFGIAGPNGAGKTTLLNVCTGALAPDSGTILFDGERVEGRPPHRLCHGGLARTFQIPQVFGSMTVAENVAIGAAFGGGAKAIDARAREALIEDALQITGLAHRRDLRVATADLLTRKMTMLAAALATRPKLVFMDEPLAGLTSQEIDRMVELISTVHARLGITFMVIEHKVRALCELSDRIMITHHGQRLCLDTPEVVMRDEQVIEVYLGPEYFA